MNNKNFTSTSEVCDVLISLPVTAHRLVGFRCSEE